MEPAVGDCGKDAAQTSEINLVGQDLSQTPYPGYLMKSALYPYFSPILNEEIEAQLK